MIALWNRWVAAACATERGTSQAIFRVFVGSVLFADAAHVLFVGALDPLFRPVADGGFAPATRPHELFALFGGPSVEVVTGLVWLSLILAGMLAVGLAGRVPAFALLQIRMALLTLPIDIHGGYDRLLHNALWLLVLANSTATLSAWCRLRTGRWTSDRLVFAFPRHFAILQLVVLYTFTGLIKVGPGWDAPHEAVYRLMHVTAYSRWDLTWTAFLYPVLQVATVVTHYWEVTFGVVGVAYAAQQGWLGDRLRALALRFDLRLLYATFGIAFHLGLFVLVDVGPFSLATLGFYAAFLSPDEWERLAARLTRRGRRARPAPG